MPPKGVKKDAEEVKRPQKLQDQLHQWLRGTEEKLLAAAKHNMEVETARMLAMIPEDIQNMKLSDFLADPSLKLSQFVQLPTDAEDQKDDQENDEGIEQEKQGRDSSLPTTSDENSCRSSASSSHRRELILPSGDVILVPDFTVKADKPLRAPHLNEKIAFTAAGSPLVLAGNSSEGTSKKPKKKTRSRIPEGEPMDY